MPVRYYRGLALPARYPAVARAGAISASLFLVLAIVKLLKLPSGWTDGLFGNISVVSSAWDFVWLQLGGALLPKLTLSVLLVGLLVYLIARRRTGWHRAVTLATVLALPLVYAGTAAAGLLTGDPDPWFSLTFDQSSQELCGILALWRSDILVATVLFALLIGCYSVRNERWIRTARVAAIVLIVLVFALVWLDLAYYLATRTELTTDELLYAVNSPRDAFIAGKDGLSLSALLGTLFVLFMLGGGLLLARFTNVTNKSEQRVRAGWTLWPLLAVVAASPAAPSTDVFQPFAENVVTRLASETVVNPVIHMATRPRDFTFSDRVPLLKGENVSVVASADARNYNIVFIMLESVRADATTVYTPLRPTTPFLAEMARESLVVDEMYAVVPRTSAAWIASLAGRYPASASALRHQFNSREGLQLDSSLPRLLRTRGYMSAWFTPTRLDFENDREIVQALGFDEVISDETLGFDASSRINVWGHEDRVILDRLDQWLGARQKDARPFLLTLMTNAAHYPYTLPKDVPPRRFGPSKSLDEEHYWNNVHYLDDLLRQIVSELRERGLLDNTIVVVLGDHGEAFFEHQDFTHFRVVYDNALRIPTVIRLPPELDRHGRVAGLRQQIDLVPTLLDALGLQLKGGPLPGRSLLSDARGHDTLFFSTHFDKNNLAMRTGSMKYIYAFGHRPMKIFDLARDPQEQRDISTTIPIRERLQAEADMLEWRRRVRVSFEPGTTQ